MVTGRDYSYNPINMSNYSNSGNPCFHGKSSVLMANGSVKRVDEDESHKPKLRKPRVKKEKIEVEATYDGF